MYQDFDWLPISGENNKLRDTAIQGFRGCYAGMLSQKFLDRKMALVAAIDLR